MQECRIHREMDARYKSAQTIRCAHLGHVEIAERRYTAIGLPYTDWWIYLSVGPDTARERVKTWPIRSSEQAQAYWAIAEQEMLEVDQ